MPLVRRVPKVGFYSRNRVEYQVVNLSDLRRFEAGTEVTPERLLSVRLVRKKKAPIKVLAKGYIRQGMYERRQGDNLLARRNFEYSV